MTTHMLKADGSHDQMVLPGLDGPTLYSPTERAKRRRDLLGVFEDAHKTESAFYLAFNRLSRNDVAFLMADLAIDDDWALFRRLCRDFKVKVA